MDKETVTMATAAYLGGFGVVLFLAPSTFNGSGMLPYFNSVITPNSSEEFYARMFGSILMGTAVGTNEYGAKSAMTKLFFSTSALIITAAAGGYFTEGTGLFMLQAPVHAVMTALQFM